MINLTIQIQKLKAASSALSSKLDELSSVILSTDDDAVYNLKEKLKNAIDTLNEDIRALQEEAENANKNIKW